LRPTAAATARTLDARPIDSASALYVMVVPQLISNSACHTRC
jgi:hypothetical protein